MAGALAEVPECAAGWAAEWAAGAAMAAGLHPKNRAGRVGYDGDAPDAGHVPGWPLNLATCCDDRMHSRIDIHRVKIREPVIGHMFEHLALKMEAAERWLAVTHEGCVAGLTGFGRT